MRGLSAYGSGGQFLNFLSDPTRTEDAFTRGNLWRLREVKRAYDPDDFSPLGPHASAGGAAGCAAGLGVVAWKLAPAALVDSHPPRVGHVRFPGANRVRSARRSPRRDE